MAGKLVVYHRLIMPSALTPASISGIAIVACCARGSPQRLRMTVTAGGAAVVDSPPAFVSDARVGTVVTGKPVVCGMAARTIQPKHARVENRIAVAACTIRR